MQAADAGDTRQDALAVVADFLQIGLKTAQTRDVFVGTQHFPGVAAHFAFAADCALSCHTILMLYTKPHDVSSLGGAECGIAGGGDDFRARAGDYFT